MRIDGRYRDMVRMSFNDGITETYIFMVKNVMFKAVLDFDKRTCMVYNDLEVVVVKVEKMSIIRMHLLQEEIRNYIKDGKKLKGFPPFGARFI